MTLHLEVELAEQPGVVEDLLRSQRAALADAARLVRLADVSHVLIAARGTSDNVARYAQHLLGRFCGLPVALASPSLTTLYHAAPRLQRTLVIGISQSGESPDVCAVLADAREQGQTTIAITNEIASPLARVAEITIAIGAGPERSVAATKTYTASLAAVAGLTAELAPGGGLGAELARVGESMQRQLDAGIGAAGAVLEGIARCAVTGRGPNYATAFEGALKIKELTGIAAEPHSPADLLHGPVAVLGPSSPLVALAVSGPALASVLDAAEQAASRSAACLAISDVPSELAHAASTIALVAVAEWLSPLVAILPLQALAAAVALERDVAVDRPFGLNKVTRTL